MMRLRRALRAGVVGAGLWALPAAAQADPESERAEQQIRRALTDWQHAFNAGDTGSVCNLFAPDLRYDYRGFPERGFAEICGLLNGSLADHFGAQPLLFIQGFVFFGAMVLSLFLLTGRRVYGRAPAVEATAAA
jgi:steroid delta-isomerase